jgi:hypothetical protein
VNYSLSSTITSWRSVWSQNMLCTSLSPDTRLGHESLLCTQKLLVCTAVRPSLYRPPKPRLKSTWARRRAQLLASVVGVSDDISSAALALRQDLLQMTTTMPMWHFTELAGRLRFVDFSDQQRAEAGNIVLSVPPRRLPHARGGGRRRWARACCTRCS